MRCGGATVTPLGIDRLVGFGAFGVDEAGPRSSGVVGPEQPSEIRLVPIPKSSDPQRLRSNLDVFGFALSDAEMADLSALDRGEQAAVDSDEFGH